MDPQRRSQLWRCGIRAFGAESATDFPVIAERAGDPEAWDFYTNRRGRIQTWQDHDADDFLDDMPEADRAALTAYTAEPLALLQYRALKREDGAPALTLTAARLGKPGGGAVELVGRAEEVSSREEAEALKGLRLYVRREDLPATDDED